MKIARTFAAAVFVLMMAVTPLSAVIAPGEFDLRFGGAGQYDPDFVVHLSDRTRLVRDLAFAPQTTGGAVPQPIANNPNDGRVLIVRFDGSSCDYLANLTFERTGTGFLIRTSAQSRGCFIGTGRYTTVALHLWTPVDAAMVQLESH